VEREKKSDASIRMKETMSRLDKEFMNEVRRKNAKKRKGIPSENI